MVMEYLEVARTYEELKKTSSRLEKIVILSKLLKKSNEDVLPKVVMLAMGGVFPEYEEYELGIANKMIIKAIGKSVGIDVKKVRDKFRETGDLGKVAESFVKNKLQRTLSKKPLTVSAVFENLQRLPKETGSGSQERKLKLISELVISSKPIEARYIVRTVLGELRIGIAHGVIRDAIADAFGVSADLVEHAWYMNSNFGEIALIAKKKGESGLKKVKLNVGRSVQVLLAEKSPGLEEALDSFKEPCLEFKYDGMRAQVHKTGNHVWIYTRRLENVTAQFPDLVKLVKENVDCERCIIEGEVLATDPKTKERIPFQKLSQRIQRKYDIEKMVKEIPVVIKLFDIIHINGKDMFDKSLKERRKMLEKIIKPGKEKIGLAEQLITKDLKKAKDFYEKALEENEEGLMVKNLDSKYQPGRRVGYWLKVKPTMEPLDLAIVGATWGSGKRAGALSSFVLACRDEETGKFLDCGMVGTGIKEKEGEEGDVTFWHLTKLLKPHIEQERGKDVKIRPNVVIEVSFEEIQKSPNYSSGFALRFPRFNRIRFEKGPDEVDTIKRVRYLYSLQRSKL